MATSPGSVGDIQTPSEAREVELTPSERDELVTKKATCPFLGSAIATRHLPVRNLAGNPLASVQDVEELGNTGGGDLGKVLGRFAVGNHSQMRGSPGHLDKPVPPDLFSLDLPGSQGSHAGHSGILQGDPTQLDSGRFSPADFQRLESRSRDGLIRRSDIARFIAENVARDPNSRFFPLRQWIQEVSDLAGSGLQILRRKDKNDAQDVEIWQSITRLAGSNHLIGSAGEFGLLLAFLHDSPRTRHGKDPAFSMADITAMFRDKRFPDGWQSWKKTVRNAVSHALRLASGAVFELTRRKLLGLTPPVSR